LLLNHVVSDDFEWPWIQYHSYMDAIYFLSPFLFVYNVLYIALRCLTVTTVCLLLAVKHTSASLSLNEVQNKWLLAHVYLQIYVIAFTGNFFLFFVTGGILPFSVVLSWTHNRLAFATRWIFFETVYESYLADWKHIPTKQLKNLPLNSTGIFIAFYLYADLFKVLWFISWVKVKVNLKFFYSSKSKKSTFYSWLLKQK